MLERERQPDRQRQEVKQKRDRCRAEREERKRKVKKERRRIWWQSLRTENERWSAQNNRSNAGEQTGRKQYNTGEYGVDAA